MGETIYAGHKFPGDPAEDASMRAYYHLNHDLEFDLPPEERVAYLDMTPEQLYRGLAQRHGITEQAAQAICHDYEAKLLRENNVK